MARFRRLTLQLLFMISVVHSAGAASVRNGMMATYGQEGDASQPNHHKAKQREKISAHRLYAC